MKSIFTYILIFTFLILFSTKVHAVHMASMDMFYRWKQISNSDSTYEFTLVYYNNCAGVTGAPFSLSIEAHSASQNITNYIVGARLATSGIGVPNLEPPNMYNCSNYYNSLCFEEYVYRGDWKSPKRANDWVFSYEICCRPGPPPSPLASENIDYDSQYIECGLNNLDFPDSKNQNWSPLWHNRRPNHPGHLTDTVINLYYKTLCAGIYYTLDQGVREYQGDSISYNFFIPQGTGGTSVTYKSPWSFTTPLPTLNGPLKINPNSGLISIVPGLPTGTGIYIIGVEAKEWRNDTIYTGGGTVVIPKQIGYNRREITVRIEDSIGCRKDSCHIKAIKLDTINADSLLRVHFHNGKSNQANSLVRCASLSPDGSEFRIVDSSTYVAPNPSALTYIGVLSATWNCQAGLTDEVVLKLAKPLTCGNYSILLRIGTDLDVIESECGYWELVNSSAEIVMDDIIPVDIGQDRKVCNWNKIREKLDAGSGYATYYWNTWDSTQIITAKAFNKYWVRVTNNFGCTSTDTMEIISLNCPPPGGMGTNDTTHTNHLGFDEENIAGIKMYPNPTNGLVYIDLPELNENVKVEVYNTLGVRVTSQLIVNGLSTKTIDFNGLDYGLYIIQISSKEKILIQKRLVYRDL